MATFTVELTITNPETGASTAADAVAGTGVAQTILPASVARSLGLEPRGTAQAQLPGGGGAQVPYAVALLTIQGRTRTAWVFLSEDQGAAPVVGTSTLRAMELEVSPTGDRLLEEDTMLLWEGAYADVGTYLRIK